MKARTASKILHHAWVFHGFSELLTSVVENDVFTLRAACRSSPVSCAACLSWPLPQPLVLAWLIWGKCHLTRVTPLAMGGCGNAIMLRPINCYLLRQTDKKKKRLFTLLCCNNLFLPWFVPNTWNVFFFFCTGLHLNYHLKFYPYWPLNCISLLPFSNQLAHSDLWPPTPTKRFPNFPPKANPSRLAAVCERLRPAAHQTLWESTGPNVLSIIIGYWKCSQ